MKQTTKQMMKRVLAVCLAVAFAALLPATVAEAATKSITMYKGESFYFTDYGKVTKASSSNSKVVKAAKDKENERHTNLTAKKTGKATVTIKSSYGTTKLKITVKKLDLSAKVLSITGGNVILEIKNKTAQTFDTILVDYAFKDIDGDVIKQDTEKIYRVPAKKTVYESIYVGQQAELLDLDSCRAKVSAAEHNPGYIYKDASSKVKATVKDETDNGSNVSFSLTTKNNTSQSVTGYNYVMIYDANDTLIGVDKMSIYLDKKATNTSTSGYISKYTYPAYDHFKIVTQAYYTVRDKNW